MDAPLPGMVDHPHPNIDEPPDDPVYRGPQLFTPECGIPDYVKDIAGKTYYEEPDLIGRKLHAQRGSSCPHLRASGKSGCPGTLSFTGVIRPERTGTWEGRQIR